MPLDPQVAALLEARAKVLPRTGTVPAVEMRALHKALLARALPGPAIHDVRDAAFAGPAGAVPVRVYRPAPQVDALIVYFHGGGWTVGSLDGWDAALRRLALRSRCAIVSVDYRLAPEHRFPAAHDDALAAVRWAGAHIVELAGAPVPLVVAGDSAGANLSTAVARIVSDEGGPAIAAQVLLYPSTDGNVDSAFMHRFVPPSLAREEIAWYFDQYAPDHAQRTDPRFAPLHAGDLAGLPPAFVGTVDNDLLREEGELYAQRLEASGVPVVARCYRGTVHGFFTADRGLAPHSDAAMADIADFIAQVLGSAAARVPSG
ncbi:alpha/beta hydrolase [Variovorax sp. 770b2]|uniref:alpha/beta hydrolase n=1 Tax=Variovorax sp. 770b2 TaxID=1566271 RepID=UPI0008EDE2AF|nr:alpha/beta hydrolase [Variovorax sp. 770b2]SFP26657.1 acetyl esterase [Variovorax sp. 770b2]